MKCLVCFANFPGSGRCPNCGHDHSLPGAADPAAVLAARDEFRSRTLEYAPETRVSSFDKLKPWIGLALGALLFFGWLKACSSFRFF
jgi:hypothetical protein